MAILLSVLTALPQFSYRTDYHLVDRMLVEKRASELVSLRTLLLTHNYALLRTQKHYHVLLCTIIYSYALSCIHMHHYVLLCAHICLQVMIFKLCLMCFIDKLYKCHMLPFTTLQKPLLMYNVKVHTALLVE